MERFFKPIKKAAGSGGNLSPDESTTAERGKKPRVGAVLNLDDIVADPGLRKPIEEYDVGIRDQVRTKYLQMGPCQPAGHNFPRKQQGNHSRSFKEVWLKMFDWLEYSVEKDAAYCFYCFLFKQPRGDKFGSDVFSKSGFHNWKNALETFTTHVGGVNSSHNYARQHCEDFKTHRQITPCLFSSRKSEMETAHGTCLTAGLDVARFLLLQGLSFCVPEKSSSSGNKGHFLEMLNWYRKDFESAGLPIIENALGYNEMTSPEIQKDLVKSCAEVIAQAIVNEIGDGYFSLLVDQPHDTLMQDRMAVIVRFVNKQGQVIERLLGVEYTTGDTGPLMKVALDGLFARRGLSISRLRGQGYNVASNMIEEFDELKSLILKENPFAYYIHCFANQFQLVVVSIARSINVVGEFFYYVDRIVNIVGDSCGTKDVLPEHCGKIVEKLERDGTLPGKGKHHESDLVGPAHTRWGSYYATLLHLLTMWDAVLDALETVCDSDTSPEQVGTASGLIKKMESFEFVFILHLMVQVLGWTEDLSRLLEQKDKYIVDAMELIVHVRDVLQDLQENRWGEFFEEVKSFCVAMSVSVPSMDDSIPVRGCSRRRRLFVTCYHHYHVEIFIALIDSITIDINNRFSKTSMELLRCIACLDPSDSFSKFNYGMLLRLAEIYSVDFSIFDREILKEQLHMFVLNVRSTSDFSSCHDLATLAVKMVQTETHLIFPLVYRLIELSLILPVATATTERAFSARNINNTDLCDEINNKWFNDMMLCYVEREIFSGIDDAKILQYFESMRS